MARKPNYDFERREREKARAAKKAEKKRAREERKASGDADPSEVQEDFGLMTTGAISGADPRADD